MDNWQEMCLEHAEFTNGYSSFIAVTDIFLEEISNLNSASSAEMLCHDSQMFRVKHDPLFSLQVNRSPPDHATHDKPRRVRTVGTDFDENDFETGEYLFSVERALLHL